MDGQRKAHGSHSGRSANFSAGYSQQQANTYLDSVEAELRDRPEIYQEFLLVMKEFKQHEISTSSVMQRVADIFKGYPYLIQGFNVFLPAGVSMVPAGSQVGPGSSRHNTSTSRSDRLDTMYSTLRLAEKIKQRCNPDVYDRFINTLSSYHHRTHDVDQEGVIREIKALLHNEQDLYSQFQYLLGDDSDR